MKRYLGIIFLLALFYFFLTTSVRAFAQTAAGSPSAQAQKVDYTLPYTGILPDNPLYFLKAIRDGVVSFLISDSQKKAEFDLLTSDKRIGAAWTLADRGKDSLAVSTLSKSNNYLALALSAAVSAKSEGKSVDAFLRNLQNATRKHEEIALSIEKEVDKSFSSRVAGERQRLSDFEKAVAKLLPQK